MAALDRSFSDNAAADIRSSGIWPKFGVTRSGRVSGNLGLSAIGNIDDRRRPEIRGVQCQEDQEILAELIAPFGPAKAESISKELIARFGTLPRVLKAFDDNADISALPANVRVYLWTLKRLISRLLRLDIKSAPILSTSEGLIAYLHHEMAHLYKETFRVLFLDADNRLIHEQVMWEGTISSVQLHPREIIHVALQRHACALILIHNHPSGNPAPSKGDITVTHALCAAATFMGIKVHDHLIVSSTGHFSMLAEGILYPQGPETVARSSIWRTWLGL